MTGATPPKRGEELLLARISAAAGRAHLGRRCATYTVAATCTAHANVVPAGGIRGLLAFARSGWLPAARARADARLDLYERGMTVSTKRRIRVVRYDTTSVFQNGPQYLTLTDVDGERIVLHGGAGEWGSGVRQAVTDAQLPLALTRLDKGERLGFGNIWLTREGIASGEVSARWSQVQRIEIRDGTVVVVGVTGTRHGPEATASGTPNLFVLHALVEHLRADGERP